MRMAKLRLAGGGEMLAPPMAVIVTQEGGRDYARLHPIGDTDSHILACTLEEAEKELNEALAVLR